MNSLLPILQLLICYYQLCFYALANCHEENSGISMESFCGHQCLVTCGKTFGPIEVYIRYDPSVEAWSQSTSIRPSIPVCPVYLTIGASHLRVAPSPGRLSESFVCHQQGTSQLCFQTDGGTQFVFAFVLVNIRIGLTSVSVMTYIVKFYHK